MSDDLLAAALSGAHVAGPETGRRCIVGRIIDTVSPANRATIADLLDTPSTGAQRIARALTVGGHPVGVASIRLHRRGLCPCPPTTRTDTAA